MALVRFRADPRRVKVSVKKVGYMWRTIVEHRIDNLAAGAVDEDPVRSVDFALKRAKRLGMADLDLECSCTYEHPQHRGSK